MHKKPKVLSSLETISTLATAGAFLGSVVDRLAGKRGGATEVGAMIGVVLGVLEEARR